MRTRGLFRYGCCAALLVGAACKNDASAPTALTAPAVVAPAAPSSAPAALPKLLRCGDFFSAAEVTALGLDASHYRVDNVQAEPGLGLRCRFGNVHAVIFQGSAFAGMMAGGKAGIASGTLKAIEGPAIGSETHWTSLGTMLSANFLSTSKLFAANISSTDKALIVKLGQALDAKMVQH